MPVIKVKAPSEIGVVIAEMLEWFIDDLADFIEQEAIKEIENGVFAGYKQKGIVDRGNLKQNLRVEKPSRFVREVISDVPYAEPINFGSRPHFPPLDVLLEWVKRKKFKKKTFTITEGGRTQFRFRGVGIDVTEVEVSDAEALKIAQGIRWKIGKEGSPPRPYFTRAMLRGMNKANIESLLRRAGFDRL